MSEIIFTPEQREQMRYCIELQNCNSDCKYFDFHGICPFPANASTIPLLDALEALETKLEAAEADRDWLAERLTRCSRDLCPQDCQNYNATLCGSNTCKQSWLNTAAAQRLKGAES